MLLLLSVLGLVCDPILAGCAAYTMADQDHLGWLTVAGRFLSRRYINLPDINTHTSSLVTPQVNLRISRMFTASSAVFALLLTTTGRVLAQDLEAQGNRGGCETLLQRREW